MTNQIYRGNHRINLEPKKYTFSINIKSKIDIVELDSILLDMCKYLKRLGAIEDNYSLSFEELE